MHMFRAVRYSGDVGFLREAAYDFMKYAPHPLDSVRGVLISYAPFARKQTNRT